MVQQLLGDFEYDIDSVTLIPSTGGVYEVVAGDSLVFSKKELGRHAEYQEVADPIRQLLGKDST